MSKFSSGTIVSLVEELVGGIQPIGETNYDKKCFENAQIMDEIISDLIYKMASLLKYVDSYEASKKSIGDYATDFVKGLRLNADDWIFRYELDEDEQVQSDKECNSISNVPDTNVGDMKGDKK